ncbi:MAG TPA: sulfite exporter TauE/SafE family protein [Steroidobacteraceae bacterium]
MNPGLLVFAAGLIGGTMNALAGGGSFVTLPALISTGMPSVLANASSTVGMYPGAAASTWAYRDSLGPIGVISLRPLVLVTLVGGAIGAVLLLSTPSTLFDFFLPWLLLLATLTLAFGRPLGERLRRRWHIRPWAVIAVQFAIGIYGGYFGGAIGLMMTAVWRLLDTRDIKSLNGPRTLMVTVANTMAVLIFIAAHAVRWTQTIELLIGAIIGGYCGALVGRRAPSSWIRAGTLVIASSITGLFFARTYFNFH